MEKCIIGSLHAKVDALTTTVATLLTMIAALTGVAVEKIATTDVSGLSDMPVITNSVDENISGDTPATVPEFATGELDKANHWWDKRINVSTKTQTKKEIYKNKPGTAKELIAEVHAEHDAYFATLGDIGTVEVIEETGSTSAPKPPGSTSAPKPPGKDYKKLILILINNITQHGVKFEEINEILAAKYGAADMNTIPAEYMSDAHAFFDSWEILLADAKEIVDKVLADAGDQGVDGLAGYAKNHGGTEYADVPVTSLQAFIDDITPWAAEWSVYAASQA